MSTKIKGTVQAWVPGEFQMQMFLKDVAAKEDVKALARLSLTEKGDNEYLKGCGWIPVGFTTMEIEVSDPKDLVGSRVDSLRAKIQNIRAQAEREVAAVQESINNLLAIEYTSSPPEG